MPRKLQDTIQEFITVFHRYSGKEGDKYKLNNAEMKKLLTGELSDFIEDTKDPNAVKEIMTNLDENKDGEVDFQEFMVLIAALTVVCSDFFVEG